MDNYIFSGVGIIDLWDGGIFSNKQRKCHRYFYCSPGSAEPVIKSRFPFIQMFIWIYHLTVLVGMEQIHHQRQCMVSPGSPTQHLAKPLN